MTKRTITKQVTMKGGISGCSKWVIDSYQVSPNGIDSTWIGYKDQTELDAGNLHCYKTASSVPLGALTSVSYADVENEVIESGSGTFLAGGTVA